MLKNYFLSLIGKSVGKISRLKGGHGSALPGLVVEKISPKFLAENLAKLPRGVVLISGTNGKTTTTKMLSEILRDQNLKVFTNPSGSNFTRGVASEMIRQMRRGKLDADIAILELDEAHAVHFVRQIQPQISLLLNVFRDQLDRFGEIDTTTKLLQKVASSTKKTVIVNARDREIQKIAREISKEKAPQVKFFGFSEKLRDLFPSDDDWHGKNYADNSKKSQQKNTPKNLVELEKISRNSAQYKINGENFTAKFQLSGAHNFLNAAAALATAKEILGEKFDAKKALNSLEKIRPAFGRGEIFALKKSTIDKTAAKIITKSSDQNSREQTAQNHEKIAKIKLILVKNPSGFQSSLNEAEKIPTLVAINDRAADGRDVSWLYDVDFANFSGNKMIFTTGIRSKDMALRLLYSDIFAREIAEISPAKKEDWHKKNLSQKSHRRIEKYYDQELERDLAEFLRMAGGKKQIFATYTAMLKIRAILKKIGGEK